MLDINDMIGEAAAYGLTTVWVGPFGPRQKQFFIFRHSDGRREIVDGFPSTRQLCEQIVIDSFISVVPMTRWNDG